VSTPVLSRTDPGGGTASPSPAGPRWRGGSAAWPQVLPALLVSAVLFCAPVVLLFASSLRGGGSAYANVLSDSYYLQVTVTTLRIALLATAATVVLGYVAAFCIARVLASSWARRIMLLLLITPMFISAVVRSFGWLVILGQQGLVNDVLQAAGMDGDRLSLLYNETGIVVGLVYILLPYAALTILAVFEASAQQLERAAADLGAGPLRRFAHVTLPLTLPGVYAGALMVFALAFTSYVTPAVLSGGQVTVLSMLIYDQVLVTFDWATAAVLAVLMLLLSVAAIAVYLRLLRPTSSRQGVDR
jgi:putative spermidine/putrescine transport system permease protein